MKQPLSRTISIALLLSATFVFDSAQAGTILQPVSVATDMGIADPFSEWLPSHVIDQSGLATTYTSGVTDFDSFVATTGSIFVNYSQWFSEGNTTTGNFDFDLGGLFTIESFALWAQTGSPGQGGK